MTRIVIPVAGTVQSAGNNVGQPTLSTISGTIRLVQFCLVALLDLAGSSSETAVEVAQISTSPVYQPPIGTTGIAPNEIACAVMLNDRYSVTTATQAQYGQYSLGGNFMVVANFPISPGVGLFLNVNSLGENTPLVTGQVVLFVE